MVEKSMPWSNNAIGDGQSYTWDEWHEMLDVLFLLDDTSMGVIRNYENELQCTEPIPGTAEIDVQLGAAVVKGRFYEVEEIVEIVAGFAPSSTGLIVLQLVYATETIRVVNRADGALVQTPGVQWEIPLAWWQTDAATSITTLEDRRTFAVSPLASPLITGAGDIQLIASTTPSANSYSFTSIPQIYSHLLLVLKCSSDAALVLDPLRLTFNGDAGANYSLFGWYGTNANTLVNSLGANYLQVGNVSAASRTITLALSPFQIWIPNYRNENMYKTLLAMSGSIPNAVPDADHRAYNLCGYWLDTDPISQIDIFLGTGDFVERQSNLLLYGIP